jgi:hypothetical protein
MSRQRPLKHLLCLCLAILGSVFSHAGSVDLLSPTEKAAWKIFIARPDNVDAGLLFPAPNGIQLMTLNYFFPEGKKADYFAATHSLPENAENVAFEIYSGEVEGSGIFFVRITDKTGQVLQYPARIDSAREWQKFQLPLNAGTFSNHWAGANDGVFHPPLSLGVYFQMGGGATNQRGSFNFRNFRARGALLPIDPTDPAPPPAIVLRDEAPKVVEKVAAPPARRARLLMAGSPVSGPLMAVQAYRAGSRFRLSTVTNASQPAIVRCDFDYQLGTNDDYFVATQPLPTRNPEVIEFALRSDPRLRYSLAIRDSTGQLHTAPFRVAREGIWEEFRFPLNTNEFRQFSGGAKDGVFHHPIYSYDLQVYRDKYPDKTPAYFELKSGRVTVAHADAEETVGVRLDLTAPDGVALVGEEVGLTVSVVNRLNRLRNVRMVLRSKLDDGTATEKVHPIQIAAEGVWSERILLPAAGPSFTGFTAEVTEDGRLIGNSKSALLVVRPMPNLGRADPGSFFGLCQSQQNMDTAERIGCKNIRDVVSISANMIDRHRWVENEERAEAARAHGMSYVIDSMLDRGNLPAQHGWSKLTDILTSPKAQAWWREFHADMARRFGGKAAGIEIENEPDGLWHGTYKGVKLGIDEAAQVYQSIIRYAVEGVRSVDSKIAILGVNPASRDLFASGEGFPGNFTFARKVWPLVADYVDIDSMHPYPANSVFDGHRVASYAFDPGYNLRGIMSSAVDVMRSAGKTPRFWPTEIGYFMLNQKTAPPDAVSLQHCAAVAQALIALKSVPSVEKVFYYNYHDHGDANYGVCRLFDCPQDEKFMAGYDHCPGPMFPNLGAVAFATTAYELHDSKPVREISCADGVFAFRFDRADGRSVIALGGRKDLDLRLVATAPASARVVNIFGRTISTGAALAADFSRTPIFISVNTDEIAALEAAITGGRIVPAHPFLVRNLRFSGIQELAIAGENPTASPVSATFRLLGETIQQTLPPGPQVVRLPLSHAWTPGDRQELEIDAGAKLERRLLPTDVLKAGYVAPGPIAGDLSGKTNHLDEIVLEDRSTLYPVDALWNGPDECSVHAWFGWNEQGLYFGAKVFDHKHVGSFEAPGNFNSSDSFQIGLDPTSEATDSYNKNSREIGLVLGDHGPRAFLTLGADASPRLMAIDFKATDSGAYTIYEAFMPWTDLKLRPPQPGRAMALSFIYNQNNGAGRAYWMGLTPGLGEAKTPGQFKTFLFTK